MFAIYSFLIYCNTEIIFNRQAELLYYEKDFETRSAQAPEASSQESIFHAIYARRTRGNDASRQTRGQEASRMGKKLLDCQRR
jgi:hypothetical protein